MKEEEKEGRKEGRLDWIGVGERGKERSGYV